MKEPATTLKELMRTEALRPVGIASSSILRPGDKVLWIPDPSDLERNMAEILGRVRVLIVEESRINGLPCVELTEEKRTVQLSLLKDTDRVFYLSGCGDSSVPPGWIYRKQVPVQRTTFSSSSNGRGDLDLFSALRGANQRLPHDTVSHLNRVLVLYPLSARKGQGCVEIESSADFYDLIFAQLKICGFSLGKDSSGRDLIEDSRLGQIADILGDAFIKQGYRPTAPLKDSSVTFQKATLYKIGTNSRLTLYHQ